MFKTIVARNLVLYVALMLLLKVSVDWDKCFEQRGRYLLGLWYNGFFKNALDEQVYKDFLKRHGTTAEEFQRGL